MRLVHPMDSVTRKNVAKLSNVEILHMTQDDAGKWLWTATSTGNFSFSSAWSIIKSSSSVFDLATMVWLPSHSAKMACCLLRRLHDRLLTTAKAEEVGHLCIVQSRIRDNLPPILSVS